MTSAGLTIQDFLPRERGGDSRTWMNAPFTLGGSYVYATNGRIMARRKLADDEANTFAELPTNHAGRLKFVEVVNNALLHTTQRQAPELSGFAICPTCNGAGKVPEKRCEDCEGTGAFERGTHEYECKNCEATGWTEALTSDPAHHMNWCHSCGGTGLDIPSHKTCVSQGVRLAARYVQLLAGATLYLGAPEQTVGWRLGDFEGALMPMRP